MLMQNTDITRIKTNKHPVCFSTQLLKRNFQNGVKQLFVL